MFVWRGNLQLPIQKMCLFFQSSAYRLKNIIIDSNEMFEEFIYEINILQLILFNLILVNIHANGKKEQDYRGTLRDWRGLKNYVYG